MRDSYFAVSVGMAKYHSLSSCTWLYAIAYILTFKQQKVFPLGLYSFAYIYISTRGKQFYTYLAAKMSFSRAEAIKMKLIQQYNHNNDRTGKAGVL